MDSIKVFVVDDSAVVRRALVELLEGAAGIDVLGAAQDPIFAMTRFERAWPDVVVLDVEMPRMDGITFLRKLMTEHPTPVVMCSTLTHAGSGTALKALSLGAVAVVGKPRVTRDQGFGDSGRALIDAVRSAARCDMTKLARCLPAAANVRGEPAPLPQPKNTADAVLARRRVAPGDGAAVVALGTSTGGTQALEYVLPRLGSDAPPLVVVQHMPAQFTRAFAERLDALSRVEVREASDHDLVRPGRVLIAPGGRHMLLCASPNGLEVRVKDGPLVSRHRPSVDVLFRSVANVAARSALGIIMTGMGDDGAAGLLEMRDAGASTIGQDERTSVIYGMPGVAMKRGAVERQLALQEIPAAIMAFGTG